MENFFPCDDCSRHFGGMAAEDDARVVQTPDDALLWSWRAHNRVRFAHATCQPVFSSMHASDSASCSQMSKLADVCKTCCTCGAGQ